MITTTTISISCFHLDQIARSGQCFRMIPLKTGGYWIISSGKFLDIQEIPNEETSLISFTCPEKDLDFWFEYFDLHTDYPAILHSIRPDDAYLTAAGQSGSGIRILKQDLWEMIITFIISQQKTIPAIRQAVEDLSRRYGSPIEISGSTADLDSAALYAFPSPKQLLNASAEDLLGLKLGYRAKYIEKITQDVCANVLDLEYLKTLDYQDAMSYLKQFYGIGEKVANCICLFGLHHIDAFPVDTWIQKILMEQYYPKHPRRYKKLPKSCLWETIIADHFGCYKGVKGVMQQYIFYYERERSGRI
ncbi:MAG: DNA glycosylase [Lachnospiraceae bacterium]